MGLYNFQPRFVPFIMSGEKTHTIRARRKHPDEVGNTLYLYTGLRTKKAKLLMEVTCAKTEEISIECNDLPFPFDLQIWKRFKVVIDGIELSGDEKEALASRDGFKNFAEMMKFWDGRLPFLGQIIHWRK